jgi:hypothetical protein
MISAVTQLHSPKYQGSISMDRTEIVLLCALFADAAWATQEKMASILVELQVTKVTRRDLFAVLGATHPLSKKGGISAELLSINAQELAQIRALVGLGA